MSLYKRGGVYWSYLWKDGVRHAQSTGTGNRKLAEQIEKKYQDELVLKHSGLTQLAPEMPFSELAARFLAEGSPRPYHIDRLKPLLPSGARCRLAGSPGLTPASIAPFATRDVRRSPIPPLTVTSKPFATSCSGRWMRESWPRIRLPGCRWYDRDASPGSSWASPRKTSC